MKIVLLLADLIKAVAITIIVLLLADLIIKFYGAVLPRSSCVSGVHSDSLHEGPQHASCFILTKNILKPSLTVTKHCKPRSD